MLRHCVISQAGCPTDVIIFFFSLSQALWEQQLHFPFLQDMQEDTLSCGPQAWKGWASLAGQADSSRCPFALSYCSMSCRYYRPQPDHL